MLKKYLRKYGSAGCLFIFLYLHRDRQELPFLLDLEKRWKKVEKCGF
jgi:hypothetical protein